MPHRMVTAATSPAIVVPSRKGGGIGKFHQYRGAFLLLTAFLLIWVMRPFLLAITVGAIFAVVLNPLLARLGRSIESRPLRAGLITASFLVAFLLPIGVIAVLGTDAALSKIHDFLANGPALNKFSASDILRQLGFQSFFDSPPAWLPASEAQIRTYLLKALEATGLMASRALQGFVADIPQLIFSNVVVMLAMYSFLADGPRAVGFFRRNSFFTAPATDRIISSVASICQSTIVASLATGLAQASLVALACGITGTSNVLLIALVSFVASFIPVIGTAPVTISLGLAALARGDAKTAVIFLATIVVVGISDNFVRPLVIKGGSEMHPLVAFISAFGGLEAMGFYGLFVGPVIAGLFFAVLPVVMNSYGRSAGRAAGV